MEEYYVKIGITALLAFAIGIDREIKKKGLGLKTLLTISITSCLLTIVSIEASYIYTATDLRIMDPGRIPSYIISGIGFLGAGVILRRNNDVISGLTTAALVWTSAGMGIAIGMGFYREAVVAIVIIMISVNFLPWLIKNYGPAKLNERKIKIKMIVEYNGGVTKILKDMKQNGITTHHVKVKDINEQQKQMDITAFINEKRYTTDVYENIKELDKVVSAEVEGL
ncbi:MgtC/SapB family protein [Texcoconibacillus texcoconensis]|uniref:Putative Mg2+ transporter-C (MgtC) family protein n=1 Tax=Texcoconibacillus texcoconensis TaxID=1095777 RepID=A0A840QM70_9BACI|nr:MgtC/SapB family protein [Texcoconibacillus texcoconensis]MBB5172472.1 putative Mg2+ transporter-C (MgtC) family protein [Texcoconibacillus texcoconensis]